MTVIVTPAGIDDTSAFQAAINTAQATGDEIFLAPGTCRIKSALTISDRIRIRGVGYEGDSGGGFAGHTVTQSTGFRSSTIVCDAATNCFVATTNKSVQIQDMGIAYPFGSASGVVPITIQALAGAGNANTQSSIRNVMIAGGDIGISLTNCLDYRINNNDILYQVSYGIVVNSPNYPDYQQASISDNEIWGAGNDGYQAHILVQAGGDLRITNNKLTTGGINTSGLAFYGAASGSQNMEPLVISGNSIEGPQNCIAFNTGNTAFFVGNVVITANQLWGGNRAILANAFGVAQYFLGFTITGNVFTVNGGSGRLAVQIDGAKTGVIAANVFNLAGGGSASTALYLGPHTSGVNVQSNTYDAGYTTKVNNLGVSNTIGGGSP